MRKSKLVSADADGFVIGGWREKREREEEKKRVTEGVTLLCYLAITSWTNCDFTFLSFAFLSNQSLLGSLLKVPNPTQF